MWIFRELIQAFREIRTDHKYLQAQAKKELEDLRQNGLPEGYLRHPKEAIRRWGQLAFDAWFTRQEPKYRVCSGYPPDWEWRKLVLLKQQNYKCSRCSGDIYRVRQNVRNREKVLESRSGKEVLLPKGLHLHHITPLSQGGDHSFANLTLLCPRCHSFEHPHNARLKPYRTRRPSTRKMP